ncbi:MAG: hypothetical protein ABW157_14765 [Candidatus Thiodiazotropha sp. LLP2]
MKGFFHQVALIAGLSLLFAGLLHIEQSAPLKAYAYQLIEE